MKKKGRRNINWNLIILILGVVVTGILSVFCYRLSYRRLWDGLRDFVLSMGFYFTEMFTASGGLVTPTVNRFPDIRIEEVFPWDWGEFSRKLREMWAALFTKDCFVSYLRSIAGFLHDVSFFILFFIPIVVGSVYLVRLLVVRNGKAHGEDTKPLRIFKRAVKAPYLTIRVWLSSFRAYCQGYWLIKLLLFLWLINLNVITIGLEAIAFYFYFIASFKVYEIFTQLVKLLVDILIMFSGAPVLVWLVLGCLIFDRWRKSVGYRRLNHNEMKNRGFINSMMVVSMACGTMGAKKTTFITDMILSTEAMFRDKAYELLFKNDMKLPNFPWQRFEDSIRHGIDAGLIYNLSSFEFWVRERKRRYAFREFGAYLYDYDVEFFRMKYNDELKISDIWDVLETYGKLYFIYIAETSLILSNYSIRTDSVLMDEGNFPLWYSEFFKTKPDELLSRHSHILDFDLVRLGKKIQENSKKSGALEFGILGITEIGKERQNTLELREVKKADDVANQKNDLFNTWLKMSRHPGVVDNYTFVKVITDEQRPESWGADARDLCVVLDIKGCDDVKLLMPGFLFGNLFYDLFYNRFRKFYYDVRYKRGDNTLFLYLLKNVVNLFVQHYVKIYNQFGTMKMQLETRSGTLDSEPESHDYYLAVKKIYANRFSTDCYAEFFRDKANASKWSILNAPEYATERATVDELKMQNSYFIRDLTQTFDKK